MIPTPAFQFYWSEFIHGTAAMTPEAVGGYIRLLCHQWDSGSVPDDDKAIQAITRCAPDAIASIRHKFGISEDGTLKNARLERVRCDQVDYRLKQAENARKGWNGSAGNARRMPRHSQRIASECANSMPNANPLTSSSPKGEESKSTKARASSPEEAEAYALGVGCQPGQGDAFYWKMEGCGWMNGGKPVKNWKATIMAWHKSDYMPPAVNVAQPPSSDQPAFVYTPPDRTKEPGYARIQALMDGKPLPISSEIEYLDPDCRD